MAIWKKLPTFFGSAEKKMSYFFGPFSKNRKIRNFRFFDFRNFRFSIFRKIDFSKDFLWKKCHINFFLAIFFSADQKISANNFQNAITSSNLNEFWIGQKFLKAEGLVWFKHQFSSRTIPGRQTFCASAVTPSHKWWLATNELTILNP